MSATAPEAIIFDLDGTVYRGDELVEGADRVIAALRSDDIAVRFLTNKAIDQRRDYREKLNSLGIPADTDDVVNSGWVTARYLRRHHPNRRALVVGEQPLVSELEHAGIDTTTSEPADLVVASMDRNFTYRKLHLAMTSLSNDAPFVATNPDRTCPVVDGEIPDAAGMIGAIEAVSGRSVDAVLGKPSPRMAETVMEDLAVEPGDCLMVGDRPETDIAMGARAGMQTALVLTGVTGESDLETLAVTPDHVIESIADLPTVIGGSAAVGDEVGRAKE